MFSFICLLGTIIITVYLALMYNNADIMLIVYCEVLFFLLSFMWLLFRRKTINGKIEIPVSISETGRENLIKIIIVNSAPIAVMRLKALMLVQDTVTGKSKKRWMKLAKTQDEVSDYMENIVFNDPGNYEITLKKLRIYDLTGIVYTNKKINNIKRIYIQPKIHDMCIKLTLATKNFFGESDIYDEHNPGHDRNEIFQVREYKKGDRLQNVHWKMTAKQDELMVKENSLPKACPVVFFLNYHFKRSRKTNNKAMKFIEAASSISFSMMDVECAHYVVWYDVESMDIKRVQVDDEESMYYFLNTLMKIKWEQPKEDIIERYKEKYRGEIYIWTLSLDENMILKKDDNIISRIDDKNLENSLSEIELLL